MTEEAFQVNGTWYFESEEHKTEVFMKRSVAYEKYSWADWMEIEENEDKEEEELKDDDLVFETFFDIVRCDENGNEINEGMNLGDFYEFNDIDPEDVED